MKGRTLPVSIKGTTAFLPGTSGGSNWGGVSTDPQIRLFLRQSCLTFQLPAAWRPMELEGTNSKAPIRVSLMKKSWPLYQSATPCGRADCGPMPTPGDIAWRSPLGSVDEYGNRGRTAGTATLGGSVATASGLLFIGATTDSRFRALSIPRTGKVLWTASIPSPAIATPMTFRGKSGRQYVVIAAGGPGVAGGSNRGPSFRQIFLAYALPKPGELAVNLSPIYACPFGSGSYSDGTRKPYEPDCCTGGIRSCWRSKFASRTWERGCTFHVWAVSWRKHSRRLSPFTGRLA